MRTASRAAILAGVVAVGLLAWPVWNAMHSRPIEDTRRSQPEIRLPADSLSMRLLRQGKFRELKNAQTLANLAPLVSGDQLKINAPAPSGPTRFAVPNRRHRTDRTSSRRRSRRVAQLSGRRRQVQAIGQPGGNGGSTGLLATSGPVGGGDASLVGVGSLARLARYFGSKRWTVTG